jgi:bacillolysin
MMQIHSGWKGQGPRVDAGRLAAACALGLTLLSMPAALQAQSAGRPVRVATTTRDAALDWDRTIERMTAAGTLRVSKTRPDTLLDGRMHERLDQYYGGVRVLGAQLVRQTEGGRGVSVFGSVYTDITVDTEASLTREQAVAKAVALTGGEAMPGREPELLVLPRGGVADGTGDGTVEGAGAGTGFVLVWSVPVATRVDVLRVYLDADTGAEVTRRSQLVKDTAVGTGRGVLGDEKKLSVNRVGGAFFADDQHRPPSITTLDMKGNLVRTIRLLEEFIFPTQSDIASDTDNTWTDGPIVDAHVHLGWTYDYYFKRFGRHGLDNADRPIVSVVHPVSRADIFQYLNDDDVLGTFYANAFWCGECNGGLMVFGEGLPPNLFTVDVNYLSGALDVVAHELTHGVTEYSSNLIYNGEPGALNEAFSDMMGTSVEFFFHPANRADYLIGEEVFPLVEGWARSMVNPREFGNPDHYTTRYRGPMDNFGVHINSTIPSHAFYLAIEGGTNRTSGRTVQGVGAGNREQIEKVFYRAFVSLLPPDATFAVARQATLQAATDLYGGSSAAFRAVSQAWDAVGVF